MYTAIIEIFIMYEWFPGRICIYVIRLQAIHFIRVLLGTDLFQAVPAGTEQFGTLYWDISTYVSIPTETQLVPVGTVTSSHFFETALFRYGDRLRNSWYSGKYQKSRSRLQSVPGKTNPVPTSVDSSQNPAARDRNGPGRHPPSELEPLYELGTRVRKWPEVPTVPKLNGDQPTLIRTTTTYKYRRIIYA